jgi:ribosomal protein L11 methyltransferase
LLWFEITATVPPADVEAVAALVRDVAPGGVTVEEPVDILGPEMGFRVRGSEPVLVRAYVPASELGAVLTEQLRTAMAERHPAVELTARPLYDEDWSVSWREFFGVVDYGARVVIVPSWVDHEPAPGQLVIRLDPGQAFGTGHHETTRLCLAALETTVRPGAEVLDVGTGSGILAIAATLLGAASVHAIDIDPLAAEVAVANCAANGVSDAVRVEAGLLTPEHPGRYDLVVANISTQANTALAPAFAAVLRPGGTLVLSGLLAADAHAVTAAMASHHLRRTAVAVERDWALLTFTH